MESTMKERMSCNLWHYFHTLYFSVIYTSNSFSWCAGSLIRSSSLTIYINVIYPFPHASIPLYARTSPLCDVWCIGIYTIYIYSYGWLEIIELQRTKGMGRTTKKCAILLFRIGEGKKKPIYVKARRLCSATSTKLFKSWYIFKSMGGCVFGNYSAFSTSLSYYFIKERGERKESLNFYAARRILFLFPLINADATTALALTPPGAN